MKIIVILFYSFSVLGQAFTFNDAAFRQTIIVASPGWNPTINSSLLSAYDVDSLGLTDGDPVSTLIDQGIKGYDMISSGAARPYWTNNVSEINNKGYLQFSGSQLIGTNFTVSYSQPTTVFFVMNPTANSSGTPQMFLDDGGDGAVYQGIYSQLSDFWLNAGTPRNTTQVAGWSIFEWYMNGSSSYLKINNSTVLAAGSGGTNARKGTTIGADRTGALFATTKISFVSIYTNTLSSTESSNIYYYLDQRY